MAIRKVFAAPATELGPRKVRVQCSSGAVDRMGEIIDQAGIQHAPSIPVLWSHDPEKPVGRAYPMRDPRGISVPRWNSPPRESATRLIASAAWSNPVW